MGGTPGGRLTPLSGVEPLVSNEITLTEKRPPFSAYFNRGIVATQALSYALNDKPSIAALTPHILDPADPIRIRLMGQLSEGVTSLLDRADKDGGVINAALYELNDPKGLEERLQAADHGNPKSRNVILGNEQSVDRKTKETIEGADSEDRGALKKAGVTVIDRILGKGSIPHNRFMVLSQNGAPVAVLSGSSNWTSTGLCTQTNNALVIESAEVAQRYIDYWNALKVDVAAASGDQKKLQSPTLRGFTHKNNANSLGKPIDLGGGVTVEVMFSPNTNHPPWQERYISGADEKSSELRFWLSASIGGNGSSRTAPWPKITPSKPAKKKAATKARTKKSVKRKPAKKKTVKKTAKKKMAKETSPKRTVAKKAAKKNPGKKERHGF